jgi:predicted CopG family antitoxin
VKSVKVHDDTHRALKALKAKKRSGSIDQVIREMIRESTGKPVGSASTEESERLTSF